MFTFLVEDKLLDCVDAIDKIFLWSGANDNNYSKSMEKLRKLSQLQEGWSFGDGSKIDFGCVLKARLFIYRGWAMSLPVDVFPSMDGGVSVVYYMGGDTPGEKSLEIIIHPNKGYSYSHETGRGLKFSVIEEKENINLNAVEMKLKRIESEQAWNSQGSSVSNITSISKKEGPQAGLSETLQATQKILRMENSAYRSLMPNAPVRKMNLALASAAT